MLSGSDKQDEAVPASLQDAEDSTALAATPVTGVAHAKDRHSLTSIRKTASVDTEYPSGLKIALIMISAFVSMFLVSLDRMIIATAIPQISNDFNSVTDIGWYGSGYLLTTCAFQLLYGKLYSFYNIKATYLISVALFEAGSLVCGAAPNSAAFIVGRAIAGVGGAGITSGIIVIMVHAVPLHKRPLYQGMFGAVFGIASVIGPLLGGAFTSNVTWRWCFYINLPFGGVAMVVILFLLKIPNQEASKLSATAKLAHLDFYGTAMIVPGTVCLLLALQWGGVTYSWNDARIVALLVLAGLLLLGFVLVQIFLPETATLAPRIFIQRSILAGCFSTICVGAHMMIFFYYLPLWFQAIQGLTAVDSGIRTIPLVLSMVIASIATGIVTHRVGYYTPFMIIGVCIMCVAAGLLTTLQIDTPTANLIGYQILYGFGLGLCAQAPNLAAQTVLPKPDITIGACLMFFSQLLSGAIFVSVGQNIFENQLFQRFSLIPGVEPEMLQNSGATSLIDLPPSLKALGLLAYNESLRYLFRVALIVVCLNVPGALAMEWRSVKKNDPKGEVKNTESAATDAEKVQNGE